MSNVERADAFTDQCLKGSRVDLVGPLTLTVKDVLNISDSKFSMLEKLSSNTNNNAAKVITQVDSDEHDNPRGNQRDNQSSNSTYKLLLEDKNGVRVFGYNTEPIRGLSMIPANNGIPPIMMESKLLLQRFTIKHGVVLFGQANVARVIAPDHVYPSSIYEKFLLQRFTNDIEQMRT